MDKLKDLLSQIQQLTIEEQELLLARLKEMINKRKVASRSSDDTFKYQRTDDDGSMIIKE